MKIAVLGTGRMGKAIIKTLYPIYKENLVFAGRSIEKTQDSIRELNLDMTAAKEIEVLESDIIIPTLWFADFKIWLNKYKEELRGKVVIDITNPFNETFDDFTIPFTTSAAEELQQIAPAVKIVGAFKNTYWVVFDQLIFNNILSDIYVTSNDNDARKKVIELLKPLPFRVFDAGILQNNRTIERMTLLERELAIKAGNHPRVSFHLWGVDYQ